VSVCNHSFLKYYRAYITAHKRSLERHEVFDAAQHDRAAPETCKEAVDAADEWLDLIGCLPEPMRSILLGLHRGERVGDIAAQLDISVRTVERAVAYVRLRFAPGASEQKR
jgi:DNA-directed RNA polymerase specialized sigma24 family protein